MVNNIYLIIWNVIIIYTDTFVLLNGTPNVGGINSKVKLSIAFWDKPKKPSIYNGILVSRQLGAPNEY